GERARTFWMAGRCLATRDKRIDDAVPGTEAARSRAFCLWIWADGKPAAAVDEERIVHGFPSLEAACAGVRRLFGKPGANSGHGFGPAGSAVGGPMEERCAHRTDAVTGRQHDGARPAAEQQLRFLR